MSNQKSLRMKKSQKHYRILSIEEKKQAMELINSNPSHETYTKLSEKYQTSIKNLRRWYNEGIERKPGCGRKKLNISAEKQLCDWIINQSLLQGRRVRRTQLKERAIFLFDDSGFKASKAWQDEFIRNYDIKFRVNQILHENGFLNQLQVQKFLEQKSKRENKVECPGKETAEAQTVVKQEAHCEEQKTKEFKIEELDEWFVTPDVGPKFEESYNHCPHLYRMYSPRIELFNDDSYNLEEHEEEKERQEPKQQTMRETKSKRDRKALKVLQRKRPHYCG